MAQAKKKQSTKTAKKTTAKKSCQQCSRTRSQGARRTQCCSNRERNHIYIITAMSMIAVILLCANIAIMMA